MSDYKIYSDNPYIEGDMKESVQDAGTRVSPYKL
jgi:hypothetical protein